MTNPAPEPSPQRFHQVRALFERAVSLPAAQREAFVRAQAAGDDVLASEVLTLLRHTHADTAAIAGEARRDFEAAVRDGVASPPRDAGDHVQSTATGELMEKLAKAPKLDEARYAVETEVGKGGMGAVMRIHDRHLNRRLAMKVLLERSQPRDDEEQKLVHQLLGRFLEEAQVTSQLDHPGVVPVHELGLDQRGKVYFTMRLVKGKTAGEIFHQARAEEDGWTTTRALEVVLKVCDTMAFAHDKGVLHRDLKPQNVMVGRFGEVYVMDWGLAKVLGQTDRHDLRIAKDANTGVSKIDSARKRDADGDTGSSVVSMDGQQLGTPSYMPPEQARSEALDARADVYAIGAMMYELLTGRAPYTAPGARQPAYRILNDVIDGPCKRIEEIQKGVPAELVAIVERAMQRERDDRYANVVELAADVRAFLAQRVVKAYRTGALVEMKLWMRRNRALASSLAAAVLILVAGIAITTTFWNSEARAKAQFATKVGEFEQLSLVVQCERLLVEEQSLTPGWPHQLAAMDAWLQQARQLLAQRDGIAATVASLQQRASASAGQDSAAAAAAEFLAKSLTELGGKLPKLEQAMAGLLPRQRWAKVIGPLTLAHPSARVTWAQARGAIAKADGVVASSLYAGQNIELRDEDVWGLVPIGMNPQSKLWEFYDLRSAWDSVQDPATMTIPAHDSPEGRFKISDETGIVFVLVPGGTLPPGTPVQGDDAEGQRKRLKVRLDPFFLGKYELTRGHWFRWTGENPSITNRMDLRYPVVEVNWFEADLVLRRVGLVLPSDLQWEYAIRAGTTTKWWSGNSDHEFLYSENVGIDKEREILGRKRQGLLRCGSGRPNGWGLFDMGGNVAEWCADMTFPYGAERLGDGLNPSADSDPRRNIRGGYYDRHMEYGRSDNPEFTHATTKTFDLGLRPARALCFHD